MIGLVLGAVVGVGLVLVGTSVGVEPLGRAWDRSPSPWAGVAELGKPGRGWLTKGVDQALENSTLDDALRTWGITTSLTIAGIDKARFVTETAIKTIAAGVGGVFVAGFLGASAPSSLLGVGVVCAALSVAVEIKRLETRATQRRREMIIALASFMEVTRLASQTLSVEGAIAVGARAGATWPFEVLRRALAQSLSLRKPVWEGIIALGHSFGMEELIEVGQVLESAAREGVGVSESLRARSDLLRRRVTDEALKSAKARTEQLLAPLGGIALGVGGLLITGLLMAL